MKRKRLVMALVAIAVLMSQFSIDTDAAQKRRRSNSSYRRRAAAAAKARKQKMIKSVQKNVATARKVLSAAESQIATSQVEVDKALSQLSRIHDEIESAHLDSQTAASTLHDIEEEIVSEQKSGSALAQAQATIARAKDQVHREIHRVLDSPNDHDRSGSDARLTDLAKMSPDQRERVENDSDYRIAQSRMKDAGRKVRSIRQALFQTDPDWITARQDAIESRQRTRAGSQQARSAGVGSLSDRQDLRNAQKVASAARTIISQGETRLRQLGAKTGSSYRGIK